MKRVKVKEVPFTQNVDKKKGQRKDSGTPFKERGAMTTRAFILCMDGILITDLIGWVKAQGGEPRRVLRLMRRGSWCGKTWQVHEANGYLKIEYRR